MNQFIQIKIDNFTNHISYRINLSNMNINNTTSIFNYIKKNIKYNEYYFPLYLEKNNIHKLSKKIKYLINVDYLSLQRNQIIKLPKEIKYLTQLQVLYLSYNILTNLPKEINSK